MRTVNVSSIRRNNSIDASKGVAAIMVVAGHLINYDLSRLPSPYYFRSFLYLMHMPLFCLLNGWLTCRMIEGKLTNLIKKSFFRLLLPYLAWSTVAVTAKAILAFINGSFSLLESLKTWIETLLLGTSMWFFPALILIWILAWIIYRLEKKSKILTSIAIAAVILIPFAFESRIYALQRLHDLFPIYYIGFLARRKENKEHNVSIVIKSRRILMISSVLLLLIPLLLLFYETIPGLQDITPIKIVVELICIAVVFIPCCYIIHRHRKLESAVATIGLYSLDIYCIHMVFVEYIHLQIPDWIVNALQPVSASIYFLQAVLIAATCAGIAAILRRIVPPYRWLMCGQWPKNSYFNGER